MQHNFFGRFKSGIERRFAEPVKPGTAFPVKELHLFTVFRTHNLQVLQRGWGKRRIDALDDFSFYQKTNHGESDGGANAPPFFVWKRL